MTATARQLDLLEISAPSKPKIVRVPDIRFDAPSVRSKSSEDAADLVERSPFRRKSWFRILNTLARLPEGAVLSREEIASRVGIKEGPACARLSELCVMWVEKVEGACVSSSHVQVNGYRLSVEGRKLFNRNGDNNS